jgi:hypothetical protein
VLAVVAVGHDGRMSRWLAVTLGVVFVLIGAVWTLQGASLLGGSSMSGSRMWLVIGIVVIAAGVVLLVRFGRRPSQR